jgi:C4-type Zn-finger protein
VNVEGVVERLQAVVEGLLPWLKDDVSSSESSNFRTPSSDIELEEMLQF